jgi:hypothetical protein
MSIENPEKYVHKYYSKDIYLKTYEAIISPITGEHEWVVTAGYPPIIRRPKS